MPNSYNQHEFHEETLLDFKNYTELPNNNPLVIVDSNLKIVYCNDAFRQTFYLDVLDDISQMDSNQEFVFLVKGFCNSKYKNISIDINLSSENDRLIKDYSVSIERIIIKNVQYFVLSIESLEQQKKLEIKINSLHNALDHGKLPIIILNENKEITYATKSFEGILSKEIEGIYNQNIFKVLGGILEPVDLANLNSAIDLSRSWKKIVLHNSQNSVEYWEFALNPVSNSDQLTPTFILIANNLTEHVNHTKAIERSEKKQKLIINNISDLLLIVEHIGDAVLFENANDNFCRILGLDKDEIYSSDIENLIPQKLAKEIYNSIQQFARNNEAIHQFNYKHSDEREYASKITSIIEREGDSTFYIITMKDITEEVLYRDQLKKAYHKEIQLNKMKSDFLANMSHEIRTPFNAVVGYSEIIDESFDTGDIEILKDLMDSMKEVLGRALNLFTNIIEVSQIESGEIELDMVDLNCNPIVRNVYNKMVNEAAKKNLEFILKVSEEEFIIEIDWVKFEKVVYLLIENAIKYTAEGHVYLGTKQKEKSIEITVSDTGVGIDQLQIERLLKPFTQEVEGYTRPYEGAGLGLTIAYKLTLIMGGELKISSEKNKGTKITVSFPGITQA